MPQDQISTRHHYLPEFYLRRWASGPQNKLVRFSKPVGDVVKAKEVSPKATGWEDRLYALNNVPPEASDVIEKTLFRPVDTEASTVLEKMEAGINFLTPPERLAWSTFILSLTLRHPEHVEGIQAHIMKDVRSTDARSRRVRWRRADGNPAQLEKVLATLSTEDGIRQVSLNTLARTISTARASRTLSDMDWGILRMDLGTPALLTSDRPVFWPMGLNNPLFHLMLPIGPKHVFYAVRQEAHVEFAYRASDSRHLANLLNDHVTRRARKLVFGLSKGVLPFVQARMGIDPDVTLVDRLLDLPKRGRRGGRQ